MPHSLRKVRKQRGSRTHGWGQVGQHRCHPSGRGKSGGLKHKWTYVVKYQPDRFGKKGFRPRHTSQGEIKTLNVWELDLLVDTLIREKKLKAEGGLYPVDLEALGFQKLLGAGRLTKPLAVKAHFCSEVAAKKIQDSGGQFIKPEN